MKHEILAGLLLGLVAVQVVADDRYDGPIIDMHLHELEGFYAEYQFCFPQPCEGGGATIAKDHDEVMAQTIAAMDEYNIVLGFLSGDVENLGKWTSAASGRFIASPFVERPFEFNLEQLRKDYEAGRLGGMGELATQYAGYAPADPEVAPFLALAAELDLPTLIHTLGFGRPAPTFRVSNGDPRLLEEVLVRHPKLRLFVENCGWPFADEMTAMMYQYPQLYCDVSTILHLTPQPVALRYLEELVDNALGKRIMFGSDQMIWPEVIAVVIEAIQTAEFLTKEQKADILYNNAARFLRLPEEEIARHHGVMR